MHAYNYSKRMYRIYKYLSVSIPAEVDKLLFIFMNRTSQAPPSGVSKVYLANTLMPADYDSFGMAILSCNHGEIDIADSILVTIKVIIGGHEKVKEKYQGVFLIMMSCSSFNIMDNMATNFSLTGGGCRQLPFLGSGGQFPSKFDTVIPKTPHYKGMVVWYR